MTASKGALLLFPNLLGEHKHHELFLPASIDKAVVSCQGLIAESEGGGRRFLGHFPTEKPAHNIPLVVMPQKPTVADLNFALEPLKKGERWGVVSDAGLPCVADPGAALVRRARQLNIPVQAFVGPSSVTMSLMLSGLPGQRFAFCGYVAKDSESRERELLALQKTSQAQSATQIFIESPHRNRATLESAVNVLSESTWLCVAWDLTLPTQGLVSQPVAQWKKTPLPNIDKKPAIFLLYAGTM